MQWLHQLRKFRYDEPTTLGQRLVELVPSLTTRVLIIVLSDLHDPQGVSALRRLGQEHDCVVLQFRDPAERGLRGSGFMQAREAETGRMFVTHGRSKWLDQKHLEDQFKRGGIDHLLIDIDRPYEHALRRFFQSRNLLGRGAR